MAHFWGQEPWMKPLLSKVLNGRPGVLIDVGVNEGQTLLSLRSLDRERSYLGFEPNPTCVSYVRELVHLNGFSRVEIIPSALSDKDSVLELFLFSEEESDSAASIVANFRTGMHKKSVHVCAFSFETLRPHLASAAVVAAVKIDVEGAELEVLKGLCGLLKQQRPPIVLEVLPAYEQGSQRHQRQQELYALLISLNYEVLRIHKSKALTFERVDSFGVHAETSWSDYLIWPKEEPKHFLV
jgi:FkbM family methyltransferase